MEFLAFLWRQIESYVLLHDPTDAINHIADPEYGGFCEGKYNDRMHLRDEVNTIWAHPSILWIFVLLLLPQIFVLFNKTLRQAVCYKETAEGHIVSDVPPEEDQNDLRQGFKLLHDKVCLLEQART